MADDEDPTPSPPDRGWSSPGLLRRVEANRAARPRPRRRRGLWASLHARPWTEEGTMMVVVSAVCIALLVVAISALHGAAGFSTH